MAEIQPRDYKFGVADAPKRHWLRGDMELSALVDCFGVLLPEGERFFIRSLKFYEPKIEDPVLIEEMRGFYQQEAFHSREHAGYTRQCRRSVTMSRAHLIRLSPLDSWL